MDEDGQPTGVLYEMLPLVYAKMPAPSMEEVRNMILKAGRAAAAKGLTSVQSDDLASLPGQNMAQIIEAYRSLDQEGMLPIRVYEQCRLMNQEDYRKFRTLQEGSPQNPEKNENCFRLGPLKTFCDGSLGARTAWLMEDYADQPGNRGISIYEDVEELKKLVACAHRDGMSVAIHCIGDAAAKQALDAIETAMNTYFEQNEKVRHGIVHAQILSEILMEQMAHLGVIAYMQPIFLEYDLHMAEVRIGKERLKTSYDFHRMYDLGIPIPFGTDCPVETFEPVKNIYCAVTGKDFQGLPEEGWHKEKLLTLDEAIRCYTELSAYASFDEKQKGKLAVGYLADITVMEDDLFMMEPDDLKDAKVYMTIMGGTITYQKA